MILDKCPKDGLDNITKTAEAEYSINFNEKQKKFPLSLYYHGSSSYLFVSWVKIYSFKAKDSEINHNELHCVKSVQIRSYFWSVFSPNTGNYEAEITAYLDTFHAVLCLVSFSKDFTIDNMKRSGFYG